jgi:hypothetical protein
MRMSTVSQSGFAETSTLYVTAPIADFLQSERDRLRAGRLDEPPVADADDLRLRDALEQSGPGIDDVSSAKLAKFSELWRTRHQGLLAATRRGTAFVVDFASGLHLTAERFHEANDQFVRAFGPHRAAWSFELGMPVTLGGGPWALRSEV